MLDERHFIGEWRQIRPDPSPAQIFITFGTDGQLTYTVELDDVMNVLLRWRLAGEVMITTQPDGTDEIRSSYRFRSPTMLVMTREREQYVYRRVSR